MIELLIVLVIVSVLAGIAWPNLRDFVNRSRRADAMSALAEIMQAQERWRANNPRYSSTLSDLVRPATRTTSVDGHYDLTVTTADTTASTAYTAAATARSSSPQYSDSRCRVMSVVANGGNIGYVSSNSGGSANAQPDPCWAR